MAEPLRHHLGTGLAAFRDAGLLFALNEHVLHGRGLEVQVDGDDVYLAGQLKTHRQWTATPEQIEAVRVKFEQTLLDATSRNRPEYHAGHSPGFGGQKQGPQ